MPDQTQDPDVIRHSYRVSIRAAILFDVLTHKELPEDEVKALALKHLQDVVDDLDGFDIDELEDGPHEPREASDFTILDVSSLDPADTFTGPDGGTHVKEED